MEEDDECTKNQNAVADEVVVIPKAVLQILSNSHSLALQVCDDLIGVVDVIQVCKLTGHESVDLQGAGLVRSNPECNAVRLYNAMPQAWAAQTNTYQHMTATFRFEPGVAEMKGPEERAHRVKRNS